MRPPNELECLDIIAYMESQGAADLWEPGAMMDDLLGRTCIGVADKYITDGPGYAGRVIVIIWPGAPETHDVLCYDKEGKLYRAECETRHPSL
jgi:hypothetical protein